MSEPKAPSQPARTGVQMQTQPPMKATPNSNATPPAASSWPAVDVGRMQRVLKSMLRRKAEGKLTPNPHKRRIVPKA